MIFVFLALFVGCADSSKKSMRQESETAKQNLVRPAVDSALVDKMVAPSRCRLVGTIVSIDSPQQSSTPTGPCSKAPCLASVRVESVLGYGSGFTTPIPTGAIVRVSFLFTLSSTERLFPEMNPPLPGLAAGDRFRADVLAQGDGEATGGGSFLLVVERYSKE